MSYTSGAAMDERGLRDIERWRDKIEVRLDNRQVFFLFFGSALVACLLFVLGVVVGKRLESRGRAVAPDIEDPLALLDKVAATPRTSPPVAVTFPQALFGAAARRGDANGKLVREAAMPTKAEALRPEPARAVAKPVDPAKPPLVAGSAGVPTPQAPASPADGKLVARLDTKPVEGAPVAPGPVPVLGPAPTAATKGKPRFTLQLSSFQNRAEAEAFANRFESEKSYLVVSEIPGKGTWFRVRVGDFATARDALGGKLAFEKKHGVIAYVAQR